MFWRHPLCSYILKIIIIIFLELRMITSAAILWGITYLIILRAWKKNSPHIAKKCHKFTLGFSHLWWRWWICIYKYYSLIALFRSLFDWASTRQRKYEVYLEIYLEELGHLCVFTNVGIFFLRQFSFLFYFFLSGSILYSYKLIWYRLVLNLQGYINSSLLIRHLN